MHIRRWVSIDGIQLRHFAPNVASFGYGLFLAVSATSIWGGSFPLLPLEIQSFELLAIFSLVQTIVFCCAFFLLALGAFKIPQFTKRFPVTGCAFLLLLGYASLIAPLYAPDWTQSLIVIGAILLGIGSAGFFAMWQRAFAAQEADRRSLDVIIGTAISALIYIILHTIPIAVAAFMIAFVFVPLGSLCLILTTRTIDYQQPMFKDESQSNPQVYQLAVKNLWRSALCVGGLVFIDSVTRAVALNDPSLGMVVNMLSMCGALIASLALIFIWQRYTFRFDTVLSFRTIFPLVATSLLAMPFLGMPYLQVFSGITHMFSTFAMMIMVIQCAQASRDNGIDPVFLYSIFGSIVFSLQSIGFLSGYVSASFVEPGLPQLAIIALFSTWFLAVVFYSVRGRIQADASEPLRQQRHVSNIEFIALKPPKTENADPVSDKHYRDRLSKQFVALSNHYRLSSRETEIAELIARGNSIARIAKILVVSDNTVRFHNKNLYTKLGIHKRQGLIDLLEELE
jgi:DNA-binding CsgD family transcriptional regulator